LAEFGVVFLMFVIGLEFNLPKLMRMRKLVFGLGLGQVVLTLLGALLFNLALGWLLKELGYIWRLSWQASIALGSALAMSSTAIVVKLMADRVEMESPHGQRVMGVLLFQDLAVVPLLIILPALAGEGATLWQDLGWAVLKILLALVIRHFHEGTSEGYSISCRKVLN
jgi:CPA2 family monovalent cation:H+ antiporter-2